MKRDSRISRRKVRKVRDWKNTTLLVNEDYEEVRIRVRRFFNFFSSAYAIVT